MCCSYCCYYFFGVTWHTRNTFLYIRYEVNNTVVLLIYLSFSVVLHVEIPEYISVSYRPNKT